MQNILDSKTKEVEKLAKRLFQTDCEYAKGNGTVFLHFNEETGKLLAIRCFRAYKENSKLVCDFESRKGQECLHVNLEWIKLD